MGQPKDQKPSLAVGSRVQLRGSRHGEPGTVLRIERGRVLILWRDLDYIARHRPDSLVEVDRAGVINEKAGQIAGRQD
jgi:hypothetical protein